MNRTMLGFVLLLTGSVACAGQSGKPITSLPKPSTDTQSTQPVVPDSAPVMTPSASAPDASAAPAYTPPAESAPIPAMGSEVIAPVAPVAVTPAPEAPVAPVSAGTFSQPGQGVPVTAPGSSSALPSAPSTPDMGEAPLRGSVMSVPDEPRLVRKQQHFGPGSAIAIQLKGGFAGGGIDVATPLGQRVNLRVGASFLNFNGSFNVDGMDIDGTVKFRSVTAQVDIFPFGGGFRISPGFTVYNGNNLNANLAVPAGQTFSLGDDSFTSGDMELCHMKCPPVTGTAGMTFGNRTAPSLTIGWGNMIPRSGKHLSFPFEVGVQYINNPQFHLSLMGTACGGDIVGNGCTEIEDDPEYQQDILNETNEINSDIHDLRFYPIVSFGVAWSFRVGHHE